MSEERGIEVKVRTDPEGRTCEDCGAHFVMQAGSRDVSHKVPCPNCGAPAPNEEES